jgi:hypothetical protein
MHSADFAKKFKKVTNALTGCDLRSAKHFLSRERLTAFSTPALEFKVPRASDLYSTSIRRLGHVHEDE